MKIKLYVFALIALCSYKEEMKKEKVKEPVSVDKKEVVVKKDFITLSINATVPQNDMLILFFTEEEGFKSKEQK